MRLRHRTPTRWCSRSVTIDESSPRPGRFDPDFAPWANDVLDEVDNSATRDISVKCCAQGAKTQTAMNVACYIVSEDPGPAMWVMAAADEARQFVADRMKPTFDNCPPARDSMVRAKKLEITFSTMPFYFTGAGSTSKLQSKPIRWLFLDEVRNYPKGALDTVLKRTRSFRNCKRFTISTPGMEDDAVDRAFKAGDQRVWHVHCPKCGHLQPLKFEQLKGVNPDTGAVCKFADVPGARDETGRWDFDALAYYIRYQCANPDCGHLMEDEPVTRRNMARCGKFVAMNPKAPKHRVSFHWNALLPTWVTWASIVEEFITARAALRAGDREPMKTFVTETLGEAWKDELGEIDDYGFLEARKGSYKFFETWPEATERWMAADAQIKGGEHYWYAIRDMAVGDKSRLASYGKCRTLEELEEIRRDFGVPIANCIIDSAFDSNRIYRFCLATGWKPFRGDDARWWPAKNPRTGKVFQRAWRKTRVVVNYGTKARPRPIGLYLWANDTVKDLLAEAMKGLAGDWTIPSDTPPEYMQQMTAERREVVEDARGRTVFKWKRKRKDNHMFDCECMIRIGKQIQRELVAARAPQPPTRITKPAIQ